MTLSPGVPNRTREIQKGRRADVGLVSSELRAEADDNRPSQLAHELRRQNEL